MQSVGIDAASVEQLEARRLLSGAAHLSRGAGALPQSMTAVEVVNRTLVIDLALATQSAILSKQPGTTTVTTPTDSFVVDDGDFDSIVANGSSGADRVTVTDTLGKPLSFTSGGGNDTLLVTHGIFPVDYDLGSLAPTLALALAGDADAVFSVPQHIAEIRVTDQASAELLQGTNGLLSVREFWTDGDPHIDLNDGALIVNYQHLSAMARIEDLINSARVDGRWTGSGITSTAAKNNPKHNTTLGAIEASDYKSIYGPDATFNGVTLDSDAVLVKYTYYGDTDFNGKVDGGDYSRLDLTFANEATDGDIGGWFGGDFDYNGKVDGSDYGLADLAFGSQGSPLNPPTTAGNAPTGNLPAGNLPVGNLPVGNLPANFNQLGADELLAG